MSDELNNLIMGARLGYDIARDIAKVVETIIKASHPNVQTELVTAEKNNKTQYPAVSVGNEEVKARCFIDGSVKAVESGESTVEEEAEKIASFMKIELGDDMESRLGDVKDMTKLFDQPDPSRITLEVINASQNEEMLKSVPHQMVADDLAVIARYQLGDGASCVINDGLATHLGYTPKEVLDYGASNIRNQNYSITSMGQMLADLMGGEMPFEEAEDMFSQEQGMYVISNESKLHGAAGIFCDRSLREQVAQRFDGESYIVIPSSIHETLAVRADSLTPEQARDMINDVNKTQLRGEEILSDHAYHVDGRTLKISSYDNVQKNQEQLKEFGIAAEVSKKASSGAHM